MAEITGFLKDAEGNNLIVRTSAAAVKTADGSNVETELGALKSLIAGKKPADVVADISARDAIESPQKGDLVWVEDASADDTVESGAALYLYNGTAWRKVAEVESMDVVITWANIHGKEEVEAAMAKSHEHTNKDTLDKMSDSDGRLAYNGNTLGLGVPVVASGGGVPAGLAPGCAYFEKDA